MNIISLFESNARKYAEKAMLRYAGNTYTYAQVDELSRRAATVLVQQGVQAGEVGEIWLKADSLMQAYLDDPAATEQAIVDGWYRSGDLARVDADGYLFVVDRNKDMIITGGENVYSKEVEDALLEHPAVQDAAVIGRPHPDWGETVIAMLVMQAGKSADARELDAFLATRLAKYKIPREYVVRDALPRTPTGKLMKHVLRAAV